MNKRILFLCTGNSCRSQMAEGYSRTKINDKFNIHSAGVEAHGLNPRAIKVMDEVGIDISNQQSKRIVMDQLENFDIIITLCSDARDRCPVISNSCNHVHWDLEDPATAKGTEDEIMNIYRKVRDQINERINSLT